MFKGRKKYRVNIFQITLMALVFIGNTSVSPGVQASTNSSQTDLMRDITSDFPYLEALYKNLHQNPELSFQEKETSERMANELRKLGFDVTEGVGGYGVVGILENGRGPTVLVRTDMDALPVQEQTGLAYASKVTAVEQNGMEVPVMHACGHDVNMTAWVGTARRLSSMKDHWRGTLMMIAQPAEERVAGARKMLEDGLFERFPRPDFNLALHVLEKFAAGTVSFQKGYMLANADSINIRVHGKGGHGALPYLARDPIVLGAQIVLGIQNMITRDIPALDPAVVTIGSFQAGAKHNVIPDHADLLLTVRSYSDEVRAQVINGIKRVARGQAISAGIPEDLMPEVTVLEKERTYALFNDEKLTDRITGHIKTKLGDDKVFTEGKLMGSEDFSLYSRVDPPIPGLMFWVGSTDPKKIAAKEKGEEVDIPPPHGSRFYPLPSPTIETGVYAMTEAVLELFNPSNPNIRK